MFSFIIFLFEFEKYKKLHVPVYQVNFIFTQDTRIFNENIPLESPFETCNLKR